MWARALLLGVLIITRPPLLFAAAPPLGPDRPLTSEERQALVEQQQRAFAHYQTQFQAGRLQEAIAAARKLLALHERLEGSRTEMGAQWLEWIARKSQEVGADEQAIRHAERALRVRQRLHPEGDWRVVDARLSLEEARNHAKRDQAARQELQRATNLNNQVFRLWQQKRSKEALPLAREALAIRRKILGEKHRDYAQSLFNLAAQHVALQQSRQAESNYLRALAIYKEVLGQKHPEVAASMNDLADLYREMGEYARARTLYEQSLALRKELLGDKHPLYATSLNNLGLLYKDRGEYVRARPLLEQALALRKRVLGEKHPAYTHSLNNLALLYKDMGEYARARPLLEQALALRKEVLGPKHPDYAQSLTNLASLYEHMGEQARAKPLYEQALAIIREVLGEKHPAHLIILEHLGTLYWAMAEPGRARPLLEQALALTRELLGEKHPLYASRLNNLATLYQVMGEYTRARPLFEQSVAHTREVLGEKHPDYAARLHNLAFVYRDRGEYARARSLFEQSLAINQEVLGPKHPHSTLSVMNLALLDWQEGKLAEASKQMASALRLAHQHLDDTFSALSHRQRLQLLAQTRLDLNNYLSLTAQATVFPRSVYEAVLAWKGMVGARQAEEQILRDNPDLAPLLAQLRQKRAELAQLSTQPPTPASLDDWQKRYRKLDREREELEFRLADQSAAFRTARSLDSKSVSTALPERTVLVDLLEYEQYTPAPGAMSKWRSERRLVAFVLARGEEVARVELGPVKPIADAVEAWRRPMQTLSAVDEKAAGRLRSLLWDKLAPSLAGCDRVLISPDGVLCSLPWAALPGSKPGSFLIEEVAIAQITSAHQLLRQPDSAGSSGLLALGGLDYGKGAAEAKGWIALPGTALEARTLVQQHQQRFPKGRPARLLEGSAVDKDALAAALSPSKGEARWRQVHLATHGYFDQQGKTALAMAARGAGGMNGLLGEEPASVKLDPLLGCGLVLSGANQDSERGTLTALEVSNLDLRGCEVLVLSACETGLGKLQAGEGVLGLQSAFHLAGARTVVASLWSVSDPATSVLMEQFYKNLWADKPGSRLEALRQAQLYVLRHPEAVRQRARELRAEVVKAGRGTAEELRGKGKEVEFAEPGVPATGLSHPAWWAPFVLSGDIGPLKP
jgi:CHAT domain-containing protein/tetratricopeptide (TPR) repeat protein